MEPLYTAKTDYTPEVLERMNRKVLSRSKPFIIAIVIMAVLIVLSPPHGCTKSARQA